MPLLVPDRIRPGTRARGWLAAAAYLVAAFVVLFPVLRTPLIADDFVNPFQQTASNGTGLLNGIEYGWKGATEGASFRIVGNVFGGAVNALWLQASALTGIRLEALYALIKFVVLVACAMSIADFTVRAARYTGRRLRFRSVLWAVSAALFLTLQIHAFWSNDPVASYPLAGFGAAAIGFFSMSTLVSLVERPTWRSAGIAGLAGGTSVLYYELNVAALAGAALLVLHAIVSRRAIRGASLRLFIRAAAAGAVPAGLLVLGRFVTGGHADQYAGTTTRVSGEAMRTFIEGMISCLPGAGWKLSRRILGGTPWIAPWGLVVAAAIGAGVTLFGLRRHRIRAVGDQSDPADLVPREDDPTGDESFEYGPESDGPVIVGSSVAPQPTRGPRGATFVVAVALVTYWAIAIGIQAITVKVQDESAGIGYVYTASAIGSSVVAIAICWILVVAYRHVRSMATTAAVGLALLGFITVQQSLNWQLAERLDTMFIVNSTLLAGFDDDVQPAERCARLERWAAGVWPEYYEVAMINGIEIAFRSYFGESFCAGFVRPP